MKHKAHGFTIVELLIVIVIIAILAAITLVSYNGITRRANNAAIVSAAQQTYKLIESYIAINGVYPKATDGYWCAVSSSAGCYSTPVLAPSMASVGALPQSVPPSGSLRSGIVYRYISGHTYEGKPAPAAMGYWLKGTNQQCGMSGVMNSWSGASKASTSGYTVGADTGGDVTLCGITIEGPEA